jgi:hypothetical protein
LFDRWDGNWIDCEVEVSVGAFRGRFRANLRSDELGTFCAELEALNGTLEGTASLNTMEEQIALSLTGDGKGPFRVQGTAVDTAGSGNRLQFGFEIDQMYLPEILGSLEQLLKAFPVIGTPDT